MSLSSTEQVVHDRINLGRLVKRIEKNATEDDWGPAGGKDTWVRAQGTLQKIRHAKRLLKNVEADDMDISSKSAQRYRDMRIALDRTEEFVSNIEKQAAPKPQRPASILSTIPTPKPPTPPPERPSHAKSPSLAPDSLIPSDMTPTISLPTDDLLLSPAESSALPSSFGESISGPSSSVPIISPPTLPTTSTPSQPTKSTAMATPAFAHNSQALQQELSDQLAQMATQLKRNAIHFSESMSKDKAVVEEAQVKIESNYDIMTRERLRVRDLRGKTGGTTCLVVMSVVAVLVAFIFMVLVIRAT